MLPKWLTNFPISVSWQGHIGGKAFFCRDCYSVEPKDGEELVWESQDMTYTLDFENKGGDCPGAGAKCPNCGHIFTDREMGGEVILTVMSITQGPTLQKLIADGKKICEHGQQNRNCLDCIEKRNKEYEEEWRREQEDEALILAEEQRTGWSL